MIPRPAASPKATRSRPAATAAVRRSDRAWDEGARALAAAARFLRTGVRSVHEVRAYLTRREVSPAVVRRVIDQLLTHGSVDDRACARLWAEHWLRRGYAWNAVRIKLTAKGLEARTIDEVARRLGAALNDEAQARVVAAKYAGVGGGFRQRVRLARGLAARGFETDVIERVVSDLCGPAPSP